MAHTRQYTRHTLIFSQDSQVRSLQDWSPAFCKRECSLLLMNGSVHRLMRYACSALHRYSTEPPTHETDTFRLGLAEPEPQGLERGCRLGTGALVAADGGQFGRSVGGACGPLHHRSAPTPTPYMNDTNPGSGCNISMQTEQDEWAVRLSAILTSSCLIKEWMQPHQCLCLYTSSVMAFALEWLLGHSFDQVPSYILMQDIDVILPGFRLQFDNRMNCCLCQCILLRALRSFAENLNGRPAFSLLR